VRRRLALLRGLGAGLAPLAACREAEPDRRARVPLAGLALGQRRAIEHGEDVFEIVRTADGAVARSLVCPHYGCRVAWVEARRQYHCPCHDGRFDADGRPVAGPPAGPLRAIRVTVEGDTALVGEP
jgi:Rieske Fe-S protein